MNAAYLKDEAGSDELWRGGMMHTGDVGHIDAAGNLQITDRMKDMIKSGGEWVSSLALENLASTVDGVGEVAAIGIPDFRWGERPFLLVVAVQSADHVTVEGAIRAVFRDAVSCGSLSTWAMPEEIKFVDEIAKTSVGKITRRRSVQ